MLLGCCLCFLKSFLLFCRYAGLDKQPIAGFMLLSDLWSPGKCIWYLDKLIRNEACGKGFAVRHTLYHANYRDRIIQVSLHKHNNLNCNYIKRSRKILVLINTIYHYNQSNISHLNMYLKIIF